MDGGNSERYGVLHIALENFKDKVDRTKVYKDKYTRLQTKTNNHRTIFWVKTK